MVNKEEWKRIRGDELSKTKLEKPVKRGVSRSEVIHSNGKTRPIRDEKGHFMGSESIVDLDVSVVKKPMRATQSLPIIDRKDITFKTVKNNRGKTYTVGVVNTGSDVYNDMDTLKLFRVYNESGSSTLVFSKEQNPTNGKWAVELVTTLYNPKADIIALERALRKYKENP